MLMRPPTRGEGWGALPKATRWNSKEPAGTARTGKTADEIGSVPKRKKSPERGARELRISLKIDEHTYQFKVILPL